MFSVLVDRDGGQKSEWANESNNHIRGDLMQFVAISGDPLSTELTRTRLSEIQDLMFRLPSNMNKLAGLKGKSIADIIAMGLPVQAPSNVTKKWTRLITFLAWAVEHGYIAENYA